MSTLAIIFTCALYFIISLIARNNIYGDLTWRRYPKKRPIVCTSKETFIELNARKLSIYFSLIFPIYFGFKCGYVISEVLYHTILTDKNYENRIIAWLF